MKYIFIIFTTSGGYWGGDGMKFETLEECLEFRTQYRKFAKLNNGFVSGYCEAINETD